MYTVAFERGLGVSSQDKKASRTILVNNAPLHDILESRFELPVKL